MAAVSTNPMLPLALLFLLLLQQQQGAAALRNGLALTPPRGFSTVWAPLDLRRGSSDSARLLLNLPLELQRVMLLFLFLWWSALLPTAAPRRADT